MSKVELAKMLGLELDTDYEYTEDQLLEDYFEDLHKLSSWCYEKHSFCEGNITIVVEENLVKKLTNNYNNYNLSLKDWELYYKKLFVKEYNDMVWELAADEYLARIKNAAMTIKV